VLIANDLDAPLKQPASFKRQKFQSVTYISSHLIFMPVSLADSKQAVAIADCKAFISSGSSECSLPTDINPKTMLSTAR